MSNYDKMTPLTFFNTFKTSLLNTSVLQVTIATYSADAVHPIHPASSVSVLVISQKESCYHGLVQDTLAQMKKQQLALINNIMQFCYNTILHPDFSGSLASKYYWLPGQTLGNWNFFTA